MKLRVFKQFEPVPDHIFVVVGTFREEWIFFSFDIAFAKLCKFVVG